jgi:hypothetical protein
MDSLFGIALVAVWVVVSVVALRTAYVAPGRAGRLLTRRPDCK